MTVRPWYVGQALGSATKLNEVLDALTEAEVMHCLELEAGTLRRKSLLRRLIGRAARLHAAKLQQKYLVVQPPPQ